MAKTAAKTSPFAPARLPEMPPVPGVRLAACEAGIRYAGRTDLMTAVLDAGHGRGRRAHPLQDVLGAGIVVPGGPEARQGPRAGRQLRQRQRLHRQEGQRRPHASPRRRPPRRWGAARARSSSPRRASSASRSRRASSRISSMGSTKSAKPDAWHQAASAIMTTDTFPKLATRKVRLGAADVVINGFCQGRRHDRAGPGDHARLHLHRRGRRASPRCSAMLAAGADKTFNCITIDSDTSTSDTVLLFATGAAAAARRAVAWTRRRARTGSASPARLHDLMHELAMSGGEGRRGPDQVRHHRRERGRKRHGGAAHRLCRRQLAAGQDGHLPARTPTGDASSWRWARAARRPTATGCPSPTATCRWPRTASARPPTTRRPSPVHAGRRDPHRHRCGPGRRQGHRVDLRPHPRLHLHQRRLSQLRLRREPQILEPIVDVGRD